MKKGNKINTSSKMAGGKHARKMFGDDDKAKNFGKTIKTLLSYLSAYKILLILVVLFSIGSAAFSIIAPKLLGDATTKLFEGVVNKIYAVKNAGIDFSYIGNMLFIMLLLYIVSTLFSILQEFIMAGVSQKLTYKLRKSISLKINKLPLKYFDKQTRGEVLSRVSNDADTVGQTIGQIMSDSISSITTIIGILIMMLSINGWMTLAALIVIPVSFLLIAFVIKKSQKYFKRQQEYLGTLNGHVEEMYGGHNIIKVFNAEKRSIREFNKINNKLFNFAWKSQFLSGMMQPIMSFVSNLGYVVVSVLGGWFAIKGVIKVGDILAFIQYVRLFMEPIGQTASIASILQSTTAAAERVFEFLNEEEESPDNNEKFEPKKIKGQVEFRNVKFGYEEDNIIINDFSTKILPGQTVAIVGSTGAGKTTIVKLLMRFYDINEGAILIDNHDIKNIRRQDLRSSLGMVLQDSWLFNGTIMENIRYGNNNATDEDVIKAAQAAHVDYFIHTLPDGYNMIINEEADNISLGQKQLLTIARAFLANSKILILDEATSSVDTRTEVLIQKSMEKLMKNRTSFIIAHRLSTIRNADLILVMKDGNIVESGKHEELLEKKGFYTSLYNSQFETSSQL